MPPDGVIDSPGVLKVWGIRATDGSLSVPDHGVSSHTDTAVGNTTVNFSIAFSTAVYSATSGLDMGSTHTHVNLDVNAVGSMLLSIADGSNVLTDRRAYYQIAGDQ